MNAQQSGPSPSAQAGPGPHSGGTVVVLACAGIVAALMQTLVVPLVGELPQILHTTASNASWAVIATLLAGAICTPVMGRLGDMFGKRRMLLISILPLVAGSVICALADSLAPMVIGRALQGMGMGIVPLGISAVRDVVPAERVGSSIALISASLGIGGALGLPIAAAVAENMSWRVLFWGSAGLGAVIGALIWRVVPRIEPTGRGGFDYVGAAGLGSGLLCLLLTVSKGADWGWTSGTTLGLSAAGVVLLLLWGRWELRVTDPLVDLRVTARRQVLLTNLASVVVGFSMYAQSLIVPQLLQLPEATGYGLGQSMLAAGLWMMPGGLFMMALSPVGAKLSAARGPKVTLFVGSLVIAAGYISSLFLMGEAWGLMIVVCIGSTGVALAYGAMPALIMSAVPQSETAAANGFNALMRSVGTSVSAAVVGVVLAQMTVRMGGYEIASEDGFRTGMLIGGGVALVAAAITLAIPGRKAPLGERTAVSPAQQEASDLARS
ncbi:MFS transporter [Streptomyces sp. NPDC059396]|uniref:MFS transporter n=1 Tax=Streptomyces sp. NPDC059396 TaxID=3346819 RepID=UPI00369C0450